MIKIHITTLGCPKNTVDTSHLIKKFVSHGFEHVDDIEDADILLINTCGFIKEAKEESIEEILRLAEAKNATAGDSPDSTTPLCSVRKSGTVPSTGKGNRKLVVFGCLAKRYRDELLNEIPEIDALFGVEEDDKIIEYCKRLEIGDLGFGISKRKKNLILTNTQAPTPNLCSYAYLKIADGCNKKCTFCVIPSIRGKFRSISKNEILEEAAEYVGKGVKELILVAQDITNYSAENGKYNLVSLLKDLAAIEGDFRIRLLYLYPTEITEELLDYIASEPKIQKYLDIPFQHSEDKILRLMGRRGTRKGYIKLIRQIRKAIPGVALRTTFIVGFPGETEEDFNGLVDFIEEMRFDRLGVFKYSKEEGTPASKLARNVPEKTKDRRLDEIMKRQAQISLEINREMIGKQYEAIIEEIEEDVVIARLYSHAPEIDGVVIIESYESQVSSLKLKDKNNNLRNSSLITLNSSLPLQVGDIVTVEIVDAYDYDLKGRVIGGCPTDIAKRSRRIGTVPVVKLK